MLSVDQAQEPSQFNQEVEDYRRVCRERFTQQSSTQVPALTPIEEQPVASPNVSSPCVSSPNVLRHTTTITAGPDTGISNSPILSRSAEAIKKPRRNSLTKVFSSLFSKKTESPELKAMKKAEKEKKEQDFRMAHLIAQMEFDGHSDTDIQTHLFQLRDQARFGSPKPNTFKELFGAMHQAFKDEFSVRRSSGAVPAPEINPFYAAASTSIINDLGFTYEDLLALESVPRGVKCLDHLPTTNYEGQELPSQQTTCAVCMQEFEHCEELRSLHCAHYFHKECIDKWLAVGTTCPVCKGEVESDC